MASQASAGIVEAIAGAEFIVRLKSTPTTGYVWEAPLLPGGVELLGSDFESPASAAPGDSGAQVFRFRADKAGDYAISFVLKRRWESQGVESRVVNVKVK